jgi:hypothetical protein
MSTDFTTCFLLCFTFSSVSIYIFTSRSILLFVIGTCFTLYNSTDKVIRSGQSPYVC